MKDAALQTVAAFPPFDLYTLDETGAIKLAHRVEPAQLLPLLVIAQGTEWQAAATIGALRLEWGRWAALQVRCSEVAERQLRTWKAKIYVELKAKTEKVTEAAWENAYRLMPEYDRLQTIVESTTESAASVAEIVQAIASKKEGLRAMASLASQGA